MKTKTYKSQKLERVADNLYRNGEDMYYARVFKNGKQHKKCLNTHDPKTAARSLTDFIRQLEREAVELPDITFDDLADKWLATLYNLKRKSKERRITSLVGLRAFFKGRKLRTITKEHIDTWASRRAVEVKARTFNADRGTLVLMLKYAQEKLNIIVESPAKGLTNRTAVKAKITPPTREQFNEVIALLKKAKNISNDITRQPYYFVQFLAYTGMRLNEARSLLWRDVNFERDTLCVTGGEYGTKNMKERAIPFFQPAKELLQEMKGKLINVKPTDRIFNLVGCNDVLRTIGKEMGLPEGEYFGHHDFRHFFCTNAIEEGIEAKVIADWLGHSDGGILVMKTYGHLRKSHSDEMAKRMTFKANC
jgi:integrase